ncbi:uncharacterized protein J3D65DRAFT_647766 [Phyllosticta citribraziliensis]|uniref:Zn(2)-C6 fungal-type domain-containing protein n=1 Tax=Phyllosticta citribraziliensis TaxID=989973 RepID=A0ABR1LD36_9PEZI
MPLTGADLHNLQHVRHDIPKPSRTSTQKVRTGCVTCKKRHIKCDEAKPHCGNCISSRRHCEGYVVGLKKKKHAGPVQLCWDSKQTVHVATPRLQHQPNPDFLDFRDSTSMFYFQEFVGLIQGSWNTAATCGDLWAVVLPQVARSNATLRHAAMAIGSLSKWHQQSNHKSLRAISAPNSQAKGEDAYYFHAVAHYCHALKMQSQQASVQDAVFLSVLSVYFEILRGNRRAALDHVNHGMALLLAVLTDRDSDHHITNLAPNPRPLLAAVADIFTNLAIQARTVLRGRFGHGSPLPHLTKGLRNKQQTMESFMVLLSRVQRPSATASDIPTAFTSLDDFEQRLTAARRDSTTMLMIMAEAIQNSGLSGSATETVSKFYKDLFDNPKLHAWCEPARQYTQVLEAAFMPLFHRIVMTEGEEEGDTRSGSSPAYLKALHLRMQYLSAILFEDPPQFIAVETMSALTPAYREYLSLARMALRAAADIAHNPARALSLQCSLAWNLLMIALFCRDPPTRDDTVALLRDYPGQDGLWNTRALHAVALRNRAVERANAFEGTPTEQWQRLWRRELLFEDGGERILLRFLEKDATTGKWECVEEAAEVRPETEVVRWERQPLTGSGGLFMVDIYSS